MMLWKRYCALPTGEELDKEVFYEDLGYVEDGRRYWLGMNLKL